VANVSHELKTPLTAIKSYVETLLAGAMLDNENNVKFLSKIDKHASNLTRLIEDILEISKLEGKKEASPFVDVDVVKVVGRALETINQKAAAKKIKIDNQLPAEGCLVKGIEDQVYRAVLNLLDNAINYNNENGTIVVSCSKQNNEVKIDISDTGLGIMPEAIPRIFERFYRVDQARSRDLGGTGLGLSIVKHVMNLHNGRVLVESELGQGSKFTLIFPV